MSFPLLSPGALPGETTLEIGAGALNFLAMLALYRAFAPSGKASARARAHANRRRELRTSLLAPKKATRQKKSITAVRGMLERLKLTRGEEVRKSAEQLAQAGWRGGDALTLYLGVRIALPPVLAILAYVLAPLVLVHAPAIERVLVGAAGIAVGAFAPTLFVTNAAQKRRQNIQLGLPDALDLFVICTEAGLGMDAAVTRVAREIGPSGPELADELALLAIELGFLPRRSDALANFDKRINLASIRGLINALTQAERYGTPLAQSLRVLAAEFRNARMMRAEEKAARLPAILTVPMIMFILPPLFVILIGPAIVQVLEQFHK
jgi:tight adherence protein C